MNKIVFCLACLLTFGLFAQDFKEPMKEGAFKPTWESLSQSDAPEWFRNAKFGIWAHWGPQCQPEQGDWYARYMYIEGDRKYNYHVENYGHPSTHGFKEVINDWKADNWNPEELVALYKRAGAKYFFAMGNHHDNLDLWDSKHHEWNSVAVGPKKNILEGWAKAARNNGLPFGISIHAAHAWRWYESAQHSDKEGSLAGVPYDGKLTKEDGVGKWWEGLDPNNLYAQNHAPSKDSETPESINQQWHWDNGAIPPSDAYSLNFYNRTIDVINTFKPELLYFDDTGLPLWPVSNVGLEIAAHYYNTNIEQNEGKLEAVLFGKVLNNEQKKAMLWDVERGAPDKIQEKAWQTDTCIGGWHYDRKLYEEGKYKSAKTVIQMLVDIVSKNGNLLLNIPIRGNGSIDKKEIEVVEGITAWMDKNSECIYDTRPWHIFGEGPKADASNPINSQGFNEGKGAPYTSKDIRFTKKGDVLYAIIMDWSATDEEINIKALATTSPYYDKSFNKVSLLHSKVSHFSFDENGLRVKLPKINTTEPIVLKIY